MIMIMIMIVIMMTHDAEIMIKRKNVFRPTITSWATVESAGDTSLPVLASLMLSYWVSSSSFISFSQFYETVDY